VVYGARHRAEQRPGETGHPHPYRYVCYLGGRERDPKGRLTVLVIALGSWGTPVPRGHMPEKRPIIPATDANRSPAAICQRRGQ
jgi:hypothetical protein